MNAIPSKKQLVLCPDILLAGVSDADFESVSARLALEMRERIEVDVFRAMGIPQGIIGGTFRPSHFPLIMPPPEIEVYRPEPFRFNPWACGVVVQPSLGLLHMTVCDSDDPPSKTSMHPTRRRYYRNYQRCLNRGRRWRANYWARQFNKFRV